MSVREVPAHTKLPAEEIIFGVGKALIFTKVVAEAVQVFAPVTVTVKILPDDTILKFKVSTGLVPKPFDHRYLVPPLAVKVRLLPTQTSTGAAGAMGAATRGRVHPC